MISTMHGFDTNPPGIMVVWYILGHAGFLSSTEGRAAGQLSDTSMLGFFCRDDTVR